MNNDQIVRILREGALTLNHDVNALDLRYVEVNNRTYSDDEFPEFKRDLLEAGSKVKMIFLEYHLELQELKEFIKKEDAQLLLFNKTEKGLIPVLVNKNKRDVHVLRFGETSNSQETLSPEQLENSWLKNEKDEIVFFVVFVYRSLVSEYGYDEDQRGQKLSPVKRLIRLLGTERKEILYIFFYAIIVGIIGLVLPLGIQTTVELISGGVFFSSVYVLIAVIILGVLITGGLQIMQISLVEYLQRRVFTKASLEFAFRIPRIKIESIMGNYAPELVNRFFDIITIQKGLPKLLIDLSSGIIQILFGLLLLSLYHPFFIFFSLILITALGLIFYFTGPSGLTSSINESKHKYKVVQWLEELARALNSFKLAGNTDLPIKRTDYNVNNYLKYRKAHFGILITQFSFIILFKAAVTGGLLIMGTILVVNREITLGQFVASEVIIILILNAVEKIIMYMDVVYDLLTAVDKVAQVTDLPLERVGGIDLPRRLQQGYAVEIKNLRYKYPGASEYVLKGIDLKIQSGQHICIAGAGGGGKTTLTNIVAGLHLGYEGGVTINNYSLRDLDLTHLRDKIAKNISPEDIFDGTILENITIGKPLETVEDAVHAMQQVGLSDELNALPEGMNTHLISGGKGLSSSMLHKLILARCIAKNPELIILNDFFAGLKKTAKLELVQCLVNPSCKWTLIAVSNDPLIMAACDRVIVLNDGLIEADDSFDALAKQGVIAKYME